jgi:hypothetical protein
MNNTPARLCRLLVTTAVLLIGAAASTLAQNNPPQTVGIPEDWTHHHAFWGDAGTAVQAIQDGNYDQWLKTVSDPRYQLQRAKQAAAARVEATALRDNSDADGDAKLDVVPEKASADLRIRSAMPAQLPRGLAKASDAPAEAGDNWDVTSSPQSDARLWFHPVPRKWHPSGVREDWSETLGSGGSLGLGNYPAKYSFSTSTASCADWVVYTTGLAGSSGQATIIAYTNLYSTTCSNVPSVSWALNTGTGSSIRTSPVLSLDGTQIAFVQNGSGGAASLVVLKWSASGTLTAPATPTSQSTGSAYRSCTAPCMFVINFSDGASDSGSSVWYDYGLDALWVGDDNGVLHKFTGIFAGSPAEVTTGGWPATVSSSPLNGPVRDTVSGNVFVGDYNLTTDSSCTPSASNSNTPCGFLYSYNYATGALNAKSAQLDYNFGIVDTPLLDESAGRLYVPVGSDGEIGASTNCGARTPCAGVFQLSTTFSNGASGTEATVGPGYEFLLIGAFDNAYLTSANGSSPTGHLYVVGNTGSANNTLYQISISANVMSTTSVVGPVVAQNFTDGYYAAGLNVTEFFNGGTDYIFVSTIAFSNYSGCGLPASLRIGCVVGFNVTSGSLSASTTPTGSSPAAGGASGIIVDNLGAAAGESNIYFSALANQTCTTSGGTSGCAIQISQSAP